MKKRISSLPAIIFGRLARSAVPVDGIYWFPYDARERTKAEQSPAPADSPDREWRSKHCAAC
jgi:hypothetical protein